MNTDNNKNTAAAQEHAAPPGMPNGRVSAQPRGISARSSSPPGKIDSGSSMPPDGEAQNETSRSSPSRREYAFALITALLFTAVNSIGLSYIYTYYAGDIEHQVLPVVTYYLIQALSALLPYLPLAVSLRSVYIRGAKKSIPLFIISAVGLMMPYISPPLLELLLGAGSNMKSYLGYIGLWLFDLLVYAVSLLTVPLIGKHDERAADSRKKRGKRTSLSAAPEQPHRDRTVSVKRLSMPAQQGSHITSAALGAMRRRAGIEADGGQSTDGIAEDKGRGKNAQCASNYETNGSSGKKSADARGTRSPFSRSGNSSGTDKVPHSTKCRRLAERLGAGIPMALRRSMTASAVIKLSIGLITEIYYAVLFFYSLANEYYRAPYTSELLIMSGLFLLQAAYALAGRLIMNISVKMLDKSKIGKEEE